MSKLNRKLFTISAIFICFFMISCFNDLTLPQTVKIRTEAEYNFTVCDFEKDFSEDFSIANLITNAGTGFDVYDYNPGNNQTKQMFLIKVPIQEIPIDFGSFIEDSNIGADIDAMSFSQEIQIPNIKIDTTKQIDTELINNNLNNAFYFTGSVGTDMQRVLFVDTTTFTSLEFESGIIEVETDPSVTGRVNLYSGRTESEAKASPLAQGTLSNGKVSFNVSTKEIFSDYSYIDFLDDSSGKPFTGKLKDNSKIIRAKGISSSEPVEVPQIEETFNVASGTDSLESLIFGSGSSLDLITNLNGWEGVSISHSIDLDGGLDLTINTENYDLEGKTFVNQDIQAKINLLISFTNADIDFSKKPSFRLKTNIGTIQKITAKLPDGVNTTISQNVPLSTEATDMVKEIVWKQGCGINVKYTNTFPSGNDFELKNVSSNFIGLTGTTDKVLTADTTNGTASFLTTDEHTTSLSTNNQIDFTATLALPGSTPGKIIATNVQPGKTYKIDIEITPIFDWKKITIDSSGTSVSNSIDIDFNLGDMLSSFDSSLGLSGTNSFARSLQFKSLPLRLYCQNPEFAGIDDANFNGKIKVYLKNSSGTEIAGTGTYLLGSTSSNANMSYASTPELIKNDKNVVTSTLSGGQYADLKDVMNASSTNPGSKLCIDFNVSLITGTSGDIVIDHDNLSSASPATINLTAFLVLPLDFYLNNDIDVDIVKLMGKDATDSSWDLLSRTSPTDTSDIQKFLDVVDYVNISYKPTKKPFISSKAINIELDIDGNGSDFAPQTLSLNGGSYKENPQRLLNTFPLQPSVKLQLQGNSDFAVPRTMAIKTLINLGIKSNGNPITIFGE